MKVKVSLLCLLAVLSVAVAAGMASGADTAYPARQIELISPTAPGGAMDTIMRAVADYAAKKWKSSVVVVNKPGGGAVPGIHYALKEARPDGYTLLGDGGQGTSMMVAAMINPPIKLEDRIFVGRVNLDPTALAVRADSQWKTLKDLNDWVKAHPKELSWGSTGPFGVSSFGIGEWLTAIGVNPFDTRMITSGGWGETMPRLLGGHIHLVCQTVAEFWPLTKAGKIRTLAVFNDRRSPFLPDVPTAAEAGVPGLKGAQWWAGLSVAVGTPQAVIDKWARLIEEMCSDPVFKKKMDDLHLSIAYLSPAATRELVYREADFYTKLAPKIGVRK